jgi:hypothetical protein
MTEETLGGLSLTQQREAMLTAISVFQSFFLSAIELPDSDSKMSSYPTELSERLCQAGPEEIAGETSGRPPTPMNHS